MAATPELAVRKALAAYLRSALSLTVTDVLSDWPAPSVPLSRPVSISVHSAGDATRSPDASTELVTMTPGAGAAATAVYRTGEALVPLAVEVWCESAFERDRWKALVDAALNVPPSVAGERVADAMDGLTLTCAAGSDGEGYFGAVATYDFEQRGEPASPEGTQREEWRALFQGTARVDVLRLATTRRQVSVTVETSVAPTVDPAGESAPLDVVTAFPES